jgi:ribosomal protein S18 acetylase RimI-like enzyme
MADVKVTYRPMREDDVPVTSYVRKNALEWLGRSQGREPAAWVPNVWPYFAHMVRTDPGGSWVAEAGGLTVGYAQAFVRGDIWFLAQLFVQPEMHSAGIGQELLRRSHAYGVERGARVFSVVASPSPVAQSLYMRLGMYAIGLGYRLTGPIAPLLDLADADASKKRIVDCGGWQDKIAELDAEVFGAERRQDQALYISGWEGGEAGHGSFGIVRDGELLGYGHVDEYGIQPLAARDPADQPALLKMGAEWLAGHDIADGRAWVTSLNHVVLGTLLRAGWKVENWTYFLASQPFGRFDRYHPSGGIML